MADEKKRVEIDVTPAVNALSRLTKSLDAHNEKVKEARTETRLLAAQAKKSNDALRDSNAALRLNTTAIEKHKQAVQQVNQQFRNQSRLMATSATRFSDMNTAIRSTNTAIGSLEQKSDKYAQTVRKLNMMGQAEATVRDRNRISLQEFGKQVGTVTQMLARKNQNINAQAQAHSRDTEELKKNTKGLDLYYLSLNNVLRIYANFMIFGAVFKFSNEIRDSVVTAKEWEQVMSEIITVSDRASFTTAHWRKELTGVSNAFGVDVLDAAAATYEALSNQVTDAAGATRFLREEVKLSLATVSTLENSVNATSSAIQAFGFSQADSSRINAIYFKTVEEGRVRLNEMANSVGRVSVLSNELNVSFVEQQAAIAMLTRKGIEADVAMTLLRNVMLKLAKPTDAMKEIFAEVGVTSGQAMIAAYGLGETLRILAERASGTGDRAAEMAELFGDIRAITGAAALTQGDLNEEMKKFGTAGASYVAAVEERFNALDTRANVQLERFQNLLINSFGQPILKNLVAFTENIGGIEGAFLNMYRVGRDIVTMLLSYKAAQIAVNTAISVYTAKVQAAKTHTVAMTRAMQVAHYGMKTLQAAAGGLATLGIALLVEAIIQLATHQQTLAINAEIATTRVMNAYDKMSAATNTRLQAQIDDATTAYELQLRVLMQGWRQYNVDLLQTVNATTSGAKERFEALGEAIKKALETPLDTVREKLRTSLSEVERTISEMEGRTKALDTFKRGEGLSRAVKNIDDAKDPETGASLGTEEKYKQLLFVRQKLEEQLQQAVRDGNLALFDELRGRADSLDQDLRQRLEQYEKESSEIITTKTHHREWQRDPLRGGKPRIVTYTTTKEEVANQQGILFAQQQLVELEKQRRAHVDARVAAEQALIAKQQEAAMREQAKLKAQEGALAAFQKTLALMDSFEAGAGNVSDFTKLIRQAEAESAAAGLDPAQRLELLRQAKAQEIELNRMAVQKMVEEETRLKTEALDKIEAQHKLSLEEQQKAETEALQAKTELVRQALEDAQNVINVTQAMDTWFQSPMVNDNGWTANQEKTDKLVADLTKLQQLATRVKEQTNILDATPEAGKERQWMIYQKRLKDYQAQLGEVLRQQNAFVTGMGTQQLGDYKLGDEKSLAEALRSSFDVLEKLDEIAQKRKQADGAENLLRRQLTDLRSALGDLPKAYEQDARAANESIDSKIQRNAVYIQQLQQTLRLLEAQRAMHEAALGGAAAGPGRALGGQVGHQHFAMGGSPRGTDTVPAMLSPRETVMTESATTAFSPLLNALNSMGPSRQTTNSQTFGDIHINVPRGSTQTQVRAIAKELTRQSRLGLLNTHGD